MQVLYELSTEYPHLDVKKLMNRILPQFDEAAEIAFRSVDRRLKYTLTGRVWGYKALDGVWTFLLTDCLLSPIGNRHTRGLFSQVTRRSPAVLLQGVSAKDARAVPVFDGKRDHANMTDQR
ncbi:unnamed protein product [Vitrella brassicaformis CCMP3155]|uniref:Transcription initiation factor IIA subunit 2 n=2 Tax=Vitrella brassicaformis TaxID=1169539 RepID=A0A0G4EEP5_VITBC|nr:unnamed protein product [Vitrella brassicaformis CCMP3155]|eukprot:CEL94481.1 unnamed protein product [Vitrella brassicaformis CCMP3155]